jgi:hypothetical protein
MHYLALAGGNAFYEKRAPGTFTPGLPQEPGTTIAQAKTDNQQRHGVLAANASSAKPKPSVLASTAERNGRDRVHPDHTMPKSVVALARNANKPKPLVIAMLPPRPPAQTPRSITDLIDMDARSTY